MLHFVLYTEQYRAVVLPIYIQGSTAQNVFYVPHVLEYDSTKLR